MPSINQALHSVCSTFVNFVNNCTNVFNSWYSLIFELLVIKVSNDSVDLKVLRFILKERSNHLIAFSFMVIIIHVVAYLFGPMNLNPLQCI